MEKTLCPTHHLFYSESECPLCRQERLERYSYKFCKDKNTQEKEEKDKEEDKPISSESLKKLVDKFK